LARCAAASRVPLALKDNIDTADFPDAIARSDFQGPARR